MMVVVVILAAAAAGLAVTHHGSPKKSSASGAGSTTTFTPVSIAKPKTETPTTLSLGVSGPGSSKGQKDGKSSKQNNPSTGKGSTTTTSPRSVITEPTATVPTTTKLPPRVVPKVVGEAMDTAYETLAAQQLAVPNWPPSCSNGVAGAQVLSGIVTSQSVKAGTRVPPATLVALTVGVTSWTSPGSGGAGATVHQGPC